MDPTHAAARLDQHRLCELDCQRLMMGFALHVDARRHDEFLALFTEDGSFERASGAFHGQAQLRQFLEGRRSDLVTRHVCTTMQVDLQPDGSARGTCYALVYMGVGDESTGTLDAGPPKVVEYSDHYVQGPAGWRIQSRRARIVFNVVATPPTS